MKKKNRGHKKKVPKTKTIVLNPPMKRRVDYVLVFLETADVIEIKPHVSNIQSPYDIPL